MSLTIERDWITASGLRAVCAVVVRERGPSHRVGYVAVPPGHTLHGASYHNENPHLTEALARRMESPLGENPSMGLMIGVLCGDMKAAPDVVFRVHGGLTYSSGKPGEDYPVKSDDLWWFGFDCHHSGDAPITPDPLWNEGVVRSREYVESECESLASQLTAIARAEGGAA